MTQRATRQTAARRGGAAPKRRGQQARRPNRPGLLDHAVAALPVSESTLRQLATWAFLALGGGIVLAVAFWFGVPGAMGVALAEGIGRAGFRANGIEVRGMQHMSRDTVYAQVQDQLSLPMPLVDLNAVRQRLLGFGWISDARVSRRLPDMLVVDVVERSPAAVWQNNGQLMLIDAAGVPLEPVNPDDMPNLPLVIGENANAQEGAYQTLMNAAPALKPQVRAATWIGNRRWDLVFNSGERLQLPEGDPDAAKALTKFAELDGRERLLGRGYVKFDMRDPDKLVIRTKGQMVQKTVNSNAESAKD